MDARRRQRLAIPFGGVIYALQLEVTVGRMIDDLILISVVGGAEYMSGRVEWIPIR